MTKLEEKRKALKKAQAEFRAAKKAQPKNPRGRPPIREGDELVNNGVGLHKSQWKAVNKRAKRKGISASELIRQAVDDYLK